MEGLEALLADEATDMAAKLGEVATREITVCKASRRGLLTTVGTFPH